MKKSTTEKSQNPEESKQTLAISSIKLQNVGPFDELGLTINFGKKLNTKKANIHIFVGENGSGKSSVLKHLFYHSFNNPRFLQCHYKTGHFFGDFDPLPDYKMQFIELEKFKKWSIFKNVFYYTPNEPMIMDSPNENIPPEMRPKYFFTKNKSWDNQEIKNWICNYPKEDYLKYIENLENNRNALLANEYKEKDEKITTEQIKRIEIKIKLTEKLNWFIKQIYNIDFKYKYKDTSTLYQPYFNNSYFFFHQLSLGYSQVICLITDILIKVWECEGSQNLENPAELSFVLLLDEIDIHLHPKAQRRILPALQTLFPNAEIFCTTHSPFVVNSVSDAWVYELSKENYVNEKGEKWQEKGDRFLNPKMTSIFEDNQTVLSEDFNYDYDFGQDANELLNELFYSIQAKKITKNYKEIIEKIRLSQNESLKSKLEFLLTKNNLEV